MFSSDPHSIKIHAYLAHQGLASRRKAEELVASGRVSVNGQRATIGQRINPETDEVKFNGQPVKSTETPVYVLLNKPHGYVSTTDDELGRPTVLRLLPEALKNLRLYPVGRLDQDSQGLMLLTNDGDIAYKLTHPKFEIPKTYEVLLDRPPTEAAINLLRRGMLLREGMTAPADVELLERDNQPWVTMNIHEGRNRQVRRMMERAGYDVKKLIRIKLGPFNLSDLQDKPIKQLDATEVQKLVAALLQ